MSAVNDAADAPMAVAAEVTAAVEVTSAVEVTAAPKTEAPPALPSVPVAEAPRAVQWTSEPVRWAPAPVETAAALAAAPAVAQPGRAEAVSISPDGFGDGRSAGPGSGPLFPADSPLSWAVLSVVRRQPLSAASAAHQAAVVTSSQAVSPNGVTADPSIAMVDGIIQGSLNASSQRGLPLTYTASRGANGGKLSLGTVPTASDVAQSFTVLPYATWQVGGAPAAGAKGTERFDVRISEVTGFDAFLTGIPLLGGLAASVIGLLQATPLVGALLAPIIGNSLLATVAVDIEKLAPGATPVAFTYKVSSFDGTPISMNFFPATGLRAGQVAPAVLSGSGLAGGGYTAPYASCGSCATVAPKIDETLGVGTLRNAGYNVVTWDPRGEFDSGGVLQLDNPFYEGRDVSALVSWIASATPTEVDRPNDPRVGMSGGSYGGGIQLTAAGTDPRIDAITPYIAWNSLNEAIYPSETLKIVPATGLLLSLVVTGARINDQIYNNVATAVLFGWISQSAQAVLASSGPTSLLTKLTAPALLTQGVDDVLFPLRQSLDNAQTILANPYGTPAKVIWFCGGHGSCVTPINPGQSTLLRESALAWLASYVKKQDDPASAIPDFQWYDQHGGYHAADLLPFQDGFATRTPVAVDATGGPLLIVGLIGGSGPGPEGVPFPDSLGNATKATNAINLDIPKTALPAGTQVVGAPTVSFRYTGLGTARAVFAQVVDNATGLVLGNIVTPVPVTLDGREHTVSIDLNDIVYTVTDPDTDNLTLQIASSATAFANASVGFIDISGIDVSLPIVN
jgi:ABC-2 type transport system ATP-binding protein